MMSGQITHGRSTLTLYIKNADVCIRDESTLEMCKIQESQTCTKHNDDVQSSAYVTDNVTRICAASDHRDQISGSTQSGRDCDKSLVRNRGAHGMLQRQSIIHDSNHSVKVSSETVNDDNEILHCDLAGVRDNAEMGGDIYGYSSSNARHQMAPASNVACRTSGVGVSPSKVNKGVSVSDSPIDARCSRAFTARQARLFLRKRNVCMKRGRLFRSPTDPRTRIVDDSLDLALQLPTLRRQSLPANYVIKNGRKQSIAVGEGSEENGVEAAGPRRRRKRSNSIPVIRTGGPVTQAGGYDDSESSSCNSEFITFQCQCQSLCLQNNDGECFINEHSTYPPYTPALHSAVSIPLSQASLDSSFEHNRDRLCLPECATSHTSASARQCDGVGDAHQPLFSCVIEPAVTASAGQGNSDPRPSCNCYLCRSVFLSDDCESDNVFMTAVQTVDRDETTDALSPHPQNEGHEATSPMKHSAYNIPERQEFLGTSTNHHRHHQRLCVRSRRDSSDSDTTSPPSSVHSMYSLSSSPVSSQMSRATSPSLSPLPARKRSNTLPSHFPNPTIGGRSRPLSLLPRDPIQPHKGDLHKLIKQRSIGENSGESDNEEEDEFFSIPTHARRSHTWSENRAWRSRKRYVRNRPATPPPGPVLTTSGGDVFEFTEKRKTIHSSREKLGIPSRDLELVPEGRVDNSEGDKSNTHHRSLVKTRSLSPICNYALFPNNNTSPQERPSVHASHNGGHTGHRMRRSRSPSPSNFSRLERILEPTSLKTSQEENNEKDDVERANVIDVQSSTSCGEECKMRSQTDALLKLAIRDDANACKS